MRFRIFGVYVRRPSGITPLGLLKKLSKGSWNHIPLITSMEKEFNVRSTFFFMTDETRYQLIPSVETLLRNLDRNGWEIGLHAGIKASTDFQLLSREKERLESILGHNVFGVRSHYLTRGGKTWENQCKLGFRYDSSINGIDVTFNQPLQPFPLFIVFPLNFHDSVVFNLKHTSLTSAIRIINSVLNRIAEKRDFFTVNVHQSWAYLTQEREAYRYLLERAEELGVSAGTMNQAYRLYLKNRGLTLGT